MILHLLSGAEGQGISQQSHSRYVAQENLCDMGRTSAVFPTPQPRSEGLGAAYALLIDRSTQMIKQVSPRGPSSSKASRAIGFDVDEGVASRTRKCRKTDIDRDRGESRDSAPPTPPCVRVRTRRFEKLR
jgi:hypothetical protein